MMRGGGGTRPVLEFLGKQVQLRLAVCYLNRSAGRILELLGIRLYQPDSAEHADSSPEGSSKTGMLRRLLEDYELMEQAAAADWKA